MRSRSSPVITILSAAAVLMLLCAPVRASDETIHPDSWVYPALRRFELLGMVTLDPAVPFTRSQCEAYVDRILQAPEGGGRRLTVRQRYLLERLREEFQGKAYRPREREDPPLWTIREGRRFAAFDLTAGASLRRRITREKGEANGMLAPSLLLDVGNGVVFETGYMIRMAPERELNSRMLKPSRREKSWRGVTAEYERAYAALAGSGWRVGAGRDYIGWGVWSDGLIMSAESISLDHLAFDISLGRFTLRAFQAVLDPFLSRRLAGHRLEIRLPRSISAGISETVLYTGRGFDWSYLLPFGSFYANQYNERGDDNILWEADIKVPVARGLIAGGELLVDDFQYESDTPGPDRLGWTVGFSALSSPAGMDLLLEARYRRLAIFTYAHKDTLLTAYLAGRGDPSIDPILGSRLGPDADMWELRGSLAVHRRVEIRASAEVIRRGEGNDLREWDRIEDPDPPFPSGEVVKERIFRAGAGIDLGRGSHAEIDGGVRRLSGGVPDEDTWFGYLSIAWDF